MSKRTSKAVAFMICLILIVSSLGVVSSKTIQMSKEINPFESGEESSSEKSFTLFRYSPDGTIAPIEIELSDLKNADIGNALEDICNSLFENDMEMQQYVDDLEEESESNLSFRMGYVYVKSSGRGFHFKTKTKFKISAWFKLRLMLPRLRFGRENGFVFCQYSNDSNASTTYYPIVRSLLLKNMSRTINGSHSVFVRKFVGYTTWIGRFSNLITSLLPRAFCGIGKFILVNKLPAS